MRFTLRGAHLVDASSDIPEGDITVENGRIVSVGDPPSRPGKLIDAANMLVIPGFIDVHTHGGGGFNLHTTAPEEIHDYARWAPSTGVTSFLIGVVGTPGALPEPQLVAAVDGIRRWQDGAEPLGIHLEGPYINERRRGAHLPAWLRAPSAAETERILALADGYLRIVTLAPELPGAAQMIRQLVEAGVRVSIGHTDATYEQAVEAIQLGASHMTHCCNAMRPLHQRDPGPLSAVAQSPEVFGELIADGVHVHPAMMYVVVKILGPERTIVITDALAAAGLDNAAFEFAGQPARVISGVARLADGTITGSVLTMDQAFRNVLRMTPVDLRQAVGMLTRNPAHAANALERKGRLARGCDADLLLLDQSLALQATLCGGSVAYASDTWQERLQPLA